MAKIKKQDDMSVRKVKEDLENKFDKFINKVSKEACDTFKPEDLDLLLTGHEHEKMESEGWFHPDSDVRETTKHACSVIANRLRRKW